MAVKTEKNGRIIKREGNGTGATSLAGALQKLQPEIARALPKHVNADRMARVFLTALRTTRKLDECTSASFWRAS